MSGRDTVHEVEASATVTLAVPRERGGELRSVVAEHLEAVGFVRSAAVVDQGEVAAHEDGLVVTSEVEVTLHFDSTGAAGEARERLAAAVSAVEEFEVLAGPYEIEAW